MVCMATWMIELPHHTRTSFQCLTRTNFSTINPLHLHQLNFIRTMASSKPEVVKSGYWWTETANSFPAANINTDLFTHIFCAFADVDPTTHNVTVTAKQTQISTFSPTIKQKDPSIKTILSIAAKPETFALMASQSSGRKSFIDSSITLARKYNFDGLDLHWRHPSRTLEMTNLGVLLGEWNDAVLSEAQEQEVPKLLLVATVFYSPYLSSFLIYPIDAMKSSLDWINVEAYDFYTPSSSAQQTGPAAAFINSKTKTLCGDYGIKQWIDKKFPSDGIVLGLPFYGWAWRLLNAAKHGAFSPTDGAATEQAGVGSDGRVDYGQIMKLISQFSATAMFDDKEIFSYAYYGTNWIAYDDGKSVSAKISKARASKLLGYFAWHIGGDDESATLATVASQQWDA